MFSPATAADYGLKLGILFMRAADTGRLHIYEARDDAVTCATKPMAVSQKGIGS
jgi:hypothetical protein